MSEADNALAVAQEADRLESERTVKTRQVFDAAGRVANQTQFQVSTHVAAAFLIGDELEFHAGRNVDLRHILVLAERNFVRIESFEFEDILVEYERRCPKVKRTGPDNNFVRGNSSFQGSFFAAWDKSQAHIDAGAKKVLTH